MISGKVVVHQRTVACGQSSVVSRHVYDGSDKNIQIQHATATLVLLLGLTLLRQYIPYFEMSSPLRVHLLWDSPNTNPSNHK